jgi:hypothetical protein
VLSDTTVKGVKSSWQAAETFCGCISAYSASCPDTVRLAAPQQDNSTVKNASGCNGRSSNWKHNNGNAAILATGVGSE